jgi:uncharacterized integral membrane protein
MPSKLILVITVIVLFLAVVFLDQNSPPVPVKIIIGTPHLIGLSAIMVISMLVGMVITAVGIVVFKRLQARISFNNRQNGNVMKSGTS